MIAIDAQVALFGSALFGATEQGERAQRYFAVGATVSLVAQKLKLVFACVKDNLKKGNI